MALSPRTPKKLKVLKIFAYPIEISRPGKTEKSPKKHRKGGQAHADQAAPPRASAAACLFTT